MPEWLAFFSLVNRDPVGFKVLTKWDHPIDNCDQRSMPVRLASICLTSASRSLIFLTSFDVLNVKPLKTEQIGELSN
jgi:hypothetical protein